MTDSRMWVDVSTAAKILKISLSTVRRKLKSKELSYRRVGIVQVSRASICQACLKESFSDATDYPLNCDTCHYFKPKSTSN